MASRALMRFVALMAFVLCSSSLAQIPNKIGRYEGTVQAEWLPGGRTMRLLKPFHYLTPDGQRWTAPAQAVVDGASIPQFAWSIIGGPFEGKYREASVIHDVACDEKKRPWEEVHETFYYGMLASGVDRIIAKIMYAAVYHGGPRWKLDSITYAPATSKVQDVLAKAAIGVTAGSTVTVEEPVGAYGPSYGRKPFLVTVTPPPASLTEADFKDMKETIELAESAFSLGGLSLEQIRRLR